MKTDAFAIVNPDHMGRNTALLKEMRDQLAGGCWQL